MKLLPFLIVTLFMTNAHGQQHREGIKQAQIEYHVFSRNYYLNITVKNKTIRIVKERDGKQKITKITTSDWETLGKLYAKIQPEKLSKLKPPSEHRHVDAAAIANLRIIYDGQLFETESFDHGNPPQEISELIKKIVSLAKVKAE